jgi:Putative aminopeptidase
VSNVKRIPHFCLAGFVLAATSACAGKPRPDVTPTPVPSATQTHFVAIEVIGELKDFEETLGGHPTGNFLRHSDRHTADNRCYFTGKLELPELYSSLNMVREDEAQCAARADEHDTFFYPVQAVASGEETITVSLAEAPIERVLVVVPHEDFHNQPEARKAPTEVSEAAATLVGFLTASAFAKERFGAESTAARQLDLDAELFLRKSLVVNVYYQKVSELYQSLRSGTLTRAQAFERKAALFAELQQSCSQILPDPVSFNKCPSAMNNAGLAFDRTYTRNYPMLHELYNLLGSDTPALVSTLKRLLRNWPVAAAGAGDLLKAE